MKKKVYFILQHLRIGGVEICVTNVANALVERGYQVVLLTVLQDNELQERIHYKVKVRCLTSLCSGGSSIIYKLKRRLISYLALWKTMKRISDAVVVSTRNEYNVMLSKYSSCNNLRIAQLHHDYWGRKNLINDFKRHYQNIDYFFILTDDVRDEIDKIMSAYNTHTKCVTIPNFYPNDDCISSQNQERNNIALAVGRLSPEKGFLRLLDVWNLVVKHSKGEYLLYIIGEGDERNAIENRIRELNLEDSVRLLGALSNLQVRNLMQKAKVYCLSSYTEGFPLVLLESLNNGLPQVAFDVRVGPRNLIANGITGYLINDNDSISYSAKIVELFEDQTKWEMMSNASKERAVLFSENNVIDKWIQIISSK